MKRLFHIIVILMAASFLFTLFSCSDESKTIYSPDTIITLPTNSPGVVTLSVSSVSSIDEFNTYIYILFDANVDPSTVDANVSVNLNLAPQILGVNFDLTTYDEITSNANDRADFLIIEMMAAITAGDVIDITLTNGILADANGSALQPPYTYSRTVQAFP